MAVCRPKPTAPRPKPKPREHIPSAVAAALVGLVLIALGVLAAQAPAGRQYPTRPATEAEQLQWQQQHLAYVIQQQMEATQ